MGNRTATVAAVRGQGYKRRRLPRAKLCCSVVLVKSFAIGQACSCVLCVKEIEWDMVAKSRDVLEGFCFYCLSEPCTLEKVCTWHTTDQHRLQKLQII